MSEEQTTQTEETSGVELLDFWATWCGPCKLMAPVLEELKEEYKDKITIKEIDVDAPENAELVQQYNIMSVPTYIFLKNGTVTDQAIGVQAKDAMAKKLDAMLSEEK